MTKYARFFFSQKRLTGVKPISLVRGELFGEFVAEVAADTSLDAEYRAFIIVCVSAGLRVEEGLSLTKASFQMDNGSLYFQSNVLKKRRADQRWCRVHPAGVALVERILREKIGDLFDWTSRTALRRVQRHFPIEGVCNHSFRHSAISYYLFSENLSIAKTAKLVHITSAIVDVYAHLDERQALSKMFQQQ